MNSNDIKSIFPKPKHPIANPLFIGPQITDKHKQLENTITNEKAKDSDTIEPH